MYDWFTLLYSRDLQYIAKQLYSKKRGGGATMALAEKTETLPEQCVAP